MSTDALLYPAVDLKLGVDGYRPNFKMPATDCCPDPLCVPACDVICSFIDILPTGPMWDRAKDAARRYFSGGGDYDPCNVVCPEAPCLTLVNYAVYGGALLHDMVSNIIWPPIRESKPNTATTTIDDWLDRFGWSDCYRSFCSSSYALALSPYTTLGTCGPEYHPTNYPDDFECALKHAILLSLRRAQRGVIKNLDGINWVIAPLGAIMRPRMPWPDGVAAMLAGTCETPDGAECWCDEAEFELCNDGETLPSCPDLRIPCGQERGVVSAVQEYRKTDGTLLAIYPAVIAAECIVRSILTRKCPNIIFRCEAVVTEIVEDDEDVGPVILPPIE